MAKRESVLRPLRPALVVSAWLFILCCSLLLLLVMYLCMTNGYINNFLLKFDLPSWYVSEGSGFGLFPPPILYSFFSKHVLFVWVPLLAIALVSIWLRNPPFQAAKSREEEEAEFDPTQLPSTRRTSRFAAFKHQAKLFFLYQLPPRRFFNWWLDGGFNVVDLIVVSLWLSINACWLYFSFRLNWDYLQISYLATGEYTEGSYTGDFCEALGYAAAWAAVYNLVFVFIPIPRSSFLQYLFNSDFSSVIRYHRWLGHGALFMTLFHGLVFYGGWWSISTAKFREETFAWQATDVNYLAGSIAFFPFGLLMWLGTIPIVRRKFFKVFLSTHIIGFLGFIIFTEIHYPQSIWYMPALALYFMDVTFRMAQWRITSGMQCTFVSADRSFVSIKLKFNKAAKVKSNQFLFLNVPSVSWFAWHPISIAAVTPGADNLSQDVVLHMKAYGSWSRRVIRKLAEEGTVSVRADGPYGSASKPEWTAYDTICMIAGGIGITPLLAMLREMQAHHTERANKSGLKWGQQWQLPGRVHLIWAVRNRDELQLLDQGLLETAGVPGSWLKLSLFHTSSNDRYVETVAASDSSETDSLSSGGKIQQPARNAPITRQLQPYGFGDFHWALAHLLAMVGAFFGCLLVSSYEFEGLVTSLEGFRIEGFGLLMLLAMIVGSMGLPALIIFPLQVIRYKKHVKATEEAHRHTSQMGMVEKAIVDSTKMSKERIHHIMPNEQAKSGVLDLETGRAATVSTGRPHIEQLLGDLVSEGESASSVAVIVSGPPSLARDAREATHRVSRIAAKQGKLRRGIPEIAFSNHSFTL